MSGVSVVWWVEIGCATRLIEWAKSQGLTDLVAPDYLHCTVAYDETASDLPPRRLLPFGEGLRPSMKPRMWLDLGPKPTFVLLGQSDAIQTRHAELQLLGMKSKFPFYRPHISFVKERKDPPPAELPLPPFPIIFSHETVNPIVEDADFVSYRKDTSMTIDTAAKKAKKKGSPRSQMLRSLMEGLSGPSGARLLRAWTKTDSHSFKGAILSLSHEMTKDWESGKKDTAALSAGPRGLSSTTLKKYPAIWKVVTGYASSPKDGIPSHFGRLGTPDMLAAMDRVLKKLDAPEFDAVLRGDLDDAHQILEAVCNPPMREKILGLLRKIAATIAQYEDNPLKD